MRQIHKGHEPQSLTDWKTDFPLTKYPDLNNLRGSQVRSDIKNYCLTEQFSLCAYCCELIVASKSHNEHIIAQKVDDTLTLTFDNIVASCESKRHCGHYKGNNSIDLTPLMSECETEIRYYINGAMTHITPRAQRTITTLGLRNKGLQGRRKQLIDTLLFDQIGNEDYLLLDNEMLQMIIDDLQTPDGNQLESFSPVLVRILRESLF